MFEQHNSFPYLSSRRVLLNEDSIKLEMLLSTEEDNIEPYWFRSGEFTKYVKFYFLLIREEELKTYSFLFSENHRINHCLVKMGRAQDTILDLSSFLQSEKLEETSKLIDYKVYGLAEILNSSNEIIANIPVSDLTEGTINNVYFEVLFPDVALASTHMEVDKLQLVAFSHLDVHQLFEDYNIGDFSASNLIKIGGNLTYEQLIIPHPQKTRAVPRSREILVAQEDIQGPEGLYFFRTGDSYSGPYFSYTGTILNPDRAPGAPIEYDRGPNDYIGFMAGTREAPIGRLDSTMIPNRIVVPTFEVSTFTGMTEAEINRSMNMMNSGDFWTPEGTNYIDYTSPAEVNWYNSKKDGLFISSKRKNLGFIGCGNETNWIDIDRNSHNRLVCIDIESIIKYNTQLGFLLEIHKGNTEMLGRLLTGCALSRVTIRRKRLTSQPSENNLLCVDEYGLFNKSDPGKLLMETSDTLGQLLVAQNFDFSIEEVNLLDAPPIEEFASNLYGSDPELLRWFVFRDTDLFRNVQFGKYTYEVELEIDNGLYKSLFLELQLFSSAINSFREFITDASHPRRRILPFSERESVVVPIEEEVGHSGNYDYRTGQYTQNFIDNHNHTAAIEALVAKYLFLTSVTHDRNIGSFADFVSRLEPRQGGTLSAAENFLKECKSYETFLKEKILNTSTNEKVAGNNRLPKWGPFDQKFKKSNKTHLGAAQYERNFDNFVPTKIEYNSTLKTTTKAFQDNQILEHANIGSVSIGADFSVVDVNGPNLNIPGASSQLLSDYQTQQFDPSVLDTSSPASNTNNASFRTPGPITLPLGYAFVQDGGVQYITTQEAFIGMTPAQRARTATGITTSCNANMNINSPTPWRFSADRYNQLLSLPFCNPGMAVVLHNLETQVYDYSIRNPNTSQGDVECENFYLTREMNEVLCQAAFKKLDLREFVDNFMSTYEIMNKFRDALGIHYSQVLQTTEILQSMLDSVVQATLSSPLDDLNERLPPRLPGESLASRDIQPEIVLFSSRNRRLKNPIIPPSPSEFTRPLATRLSWSHQGTRVRVQRMFSLEHTPSNVSRGFSPVVCNDRMIK